MINNTSKHALVVRHGGSLAGILEFWVVLDELQILNLYVKEEYRRMGIATQLIQTMLHSHPEYSVVLLEVRRSNAAALSLYRRLGLQTAGQRLRYYADGEDAVTMRLAHVSTHQAPAL